MPTLWTEGEGHTGAGVKQREPATDPT